MRADWTRAPLPEPTSRRSPAHPMNAFFKLWCSRSAATFVDVRAPVLRNHEAAAVPHRPWGLDSAPSSMTVNNHTWAPVLAPGGGLAYLGRTLLETWITRLKGRPWGSELHRCHEASGAAPSPPQKGPLVPGQGLVSPQAAPVAQDAELVPDRAWGLGPAGPAPPAGPQAVLCDFDFDHNWPTWVPVGRFSPSRPPGRACPRPATAVLGWAASTGGDGRRTTNAGRRGWSRAGSAIG
jgi:hypothetical protein